ncbi:inovirus Gp2 family protein [Comamonas sp.]|uniref:inovirus Gp2 family protein n=1 Tax=Comamonas sp. TaxID=34028 RepID=UPI00289A4C0E|nr:inovirus Gp2 family protein [Comamonas sp.]
MNRVSINKNLHIHQKSNFMGFDVQIHRGSLVENYLNRASDCITSALNKYNRVSMMRFDLHLPENSADSIICDNFIITKFFSSLKEKIEYSQTKSKRHGNRTHNTDVDYIWCREISTTEKTHYHVAIFLNGHAYRFIGEFNLSKDNMYTRIHEAWGSALFTHPEDIQGLVHIPANPSYEIIRGDEYSIHKAFHRISYMCKVDSKSFGNRHHCFGASRN